MTSPALRALVLLNTALGLTSILFAVGIAGTVRQIPPVPAPRTLSPVRASSARLNAMPDGSEAAAFPEIVRGNVFDPHRLERSSPATSVPTSSALVLQGVVVDGALGRAFLEEPTTRRVAGFSVGDVVAGGAIQRIADDRVIIATSTGLMEILLRDPSKPKPVLETVARTSALEPSTPPEHLKLPPPSPQDTGGTLTTGRRIRGRTE